MSREKRDVIIALESRDGPNGSTTFQRVAQARFAMVIWENEKGEIEISSATAEPRMLVALAAGAVRYFIDRGVIGAALELIAHNAGKSTLIDIDKPPRR